MDLCAAIPSLLAAMSVNLECSRVPGFGRLELPTGGPVGLWWRLGAAVGVRLRSWRCTSVAA